MTDDMRSNCCDEPMPDDTDICPKCKEHCGIIRKCRECDGTGRIEIQDRYRLPALAYKEIDCDICNGKGEIEE